MFNEKAFREYYEGFVSRIPVRRLLAYEDNLAKIIDSDLILGCVLSDEIIILHQIVESECVNRLLQEHGMSLDD